MTMSPAAESGPRVRPARADDAARVTTLVWAAKAHWGYRPEHLAAWADQLTIRAEQLRSQPAWVVEDDSDIIGFCSLQLTDGAAALDNLWVAPGAMRRGLGRRLLEVALARARETGFAELCIDADPYAAGFYVACGAVRCGSVAAPIAGEPRRMRPQFVLSTAPPHGHREETT